MRVSQEGVSVWYGTPDAPAPSGNVAAGADTSVTVGLQPPDAQASVTVLYRINHGAPRTVTALPTHHDSFGKQYFRADLSGFKAGDKVEYVAIYRSRSLRIPSNHEAETHVATFFVGQPAHLPAPAAVHLHPVKVRKKHCAPFCITQAPSIRRLSRTCSSGCISIIKAARRTSGTVSQDTPSSNLTLSACSSYCRSTCSCVDMCRWREPC